MDQVADHGTESDETDEPAHDEQHDDDVDEIVHEVGVSHSKAGGVPKGLSAQSARAHDVRWGRHTPPMPQSASKRHYGTTIQH